MEATVAAAPPSFCSFFFSFFCCVLDSPDISGTAAVAAVAAGSATPAFALQSNKAITGFASLHPQGLQACLPFHRSQRL